jgi:uncharacterized membrane protein
MFINIKEKLQNYLTAHKDKFYMFFLLLIILAGTIFRISGLDKFALTDDETYCYYLAKQSFPFGILNTIFNQDIHAPLYFFILHGWMKWIGENDIILRHLSVIFGILNIPVGYLIGKNLLSKKLGLLIASFISFNALLIYYSQEIKFYSLLPLLISLSFLFLIKIIKNEKSNPFDYAGLIISNLAVLYTYTFGLIFIFFQAFLFLVYFFITKREFKTFLYAQLITFGLFLPYLIIFIPHHIFNYSKTIFDVIPWSGGLSFSSLIAYIQDLFSPLLVGIRQAPDSNYYLMFLGYLFKPMFLLVVIVPIIIYFTGIVRGLVSKNSFIILTFLTGILFISVEIFLTLAGKFGILPRYMILSLIPFIITACYGLVILKNKRIQKILIVLFMIINIVFLLLAPISPQKFQRYGKGKIIANLLMKYDLKEKDIIILPPYGRSINKYSANKVNNQIYFDVLRPGCIEMLIGKDLSKNLTKDNSYPILKNYIADPYPSEVLEDYFKKNIFDKLDKLGSFVLIKDKDIAVFNRQQINYQLNNDPTAFYPYLSQAMFHMVNSKAIQDFEFLAKKYLEPVDVERTDLFVIYSYKKSDKTK